MEFAHSRRLAQYNYTPKTSPSPEASPSPEPSYTPSYQNPWGGVSLNYGSRVGFAAGAAIGVIILICVFILVCDRRRSDFRRPYVGANQHPLGVRHYLYPMQPVDTGPRKVEWPVLVVNPDNEVECGRKLYDDTTAKSKEDPSNYFESVGPGPPLFEANVLLFQNPAYGSLGSVRSLSGTQMTPLQSFRQRFRRGSDTGPDAQPTPSAFVAMPVQGVVVADTAVPLHTSDHLPVPAIDRPVTEDGTTASQQPRWSFRSPFADWNPSTGLANDSHATAVELSRTQSSGNMHRRGSSQGV